jgi:hypothetical protein
MSLWRGLSPALVMSVPGNIIYFVGYDYLRNAIKDWTMYKDKDYAPLVAGGGARGKISRPLSFFYVLSFCIRCEFHYSQMSLCTVWLQLWLSPLFRQLNSSVPGFKLPKG